MNEKSKIVIDVLTKILPEQTEMVGEDLVSDVVIGRDYTVPIDGGEYIDFKEFLDILAVSATLIKTVLEIYITIRDKFENEPKKESLVQEILSEMPSDVEIPDYININSVVREVVEIANKSD